MTFLIVLIGWMFSLCLHEFSHALVAYYGGDFTVKEKGYLTFNPLKYTHPLYSIILPMIFLLMGGIGLPGGAVYIEKWRLKNRNWESAVALAGPAANALFAVVLGLILRFGSPRMDGIWPAIAFLALLQVTAVALNLIPLPPFDGYGIIEPHLPYETRMKFAETRGMLVFLVFLILWYVPIVNRLFWGLVFIVSQLLGIPLTLAALGQSEFLALLNPSF